MNLLQTHLDGIRKTFPELVSAVTGSAGNVLSVAPSREGSPSATQGGQWIHSAYDPKKEAQSWAALQAKEWRAGELGVVFGVGLLYHIETLFASKPAGARLAVVIADIAVFKDALAARPLGPWLNAIEWIWGNVDEMATQLASKSAPLRCFTYAPAARPYAVLHQALDGELRRLLAARQHGRLHVAVVGPIYGGSLPITGYVVRALEALGHRVSWVDHSVHHASFERFNRFRDPRHRLSMQSRLADVLSMDTLTALSEDPPDLVLSMAQAPLSLGALEHLRRKKFMTAMWFVENYRHLTYWQQLAPGYDYWFTIQQQDCHEALRRAGAPHVSYLPMAADPSVHRPLTLTMNEQLEFGSDVSFVGAGYANRRTLLPRWIGKDWTFKVWGNEWDGADAIASVLQRNGARIDTETCLKVFNATAINLNLHSHTGEGLDPAADFVNPRTFELAAAGAFQLVDQRTLLPECFTEDELVTFEGSGEISSLIRTWLRDPVGRRTIADAARQRVLRQHTYEHRMKALLSELGLREPDRLGSILRGERTAEALAAQTTTPPELAPMLRQFAPDQRVELKDLAAQIRARGPRTELSREDLLILMLESYRTETRDLV
ncbi:MAG: hypothetical protein LZF86_100104 [Nitrospira sp.]|nr:MAG: hypothetical protein LZF86_100104 [Nitrospira sp.]